MSADSGRLPVKVNVRHFLELGLVSGLLSAVTLAGWWFWQAHVTWPNQGEPALAAYVFMQKPVILSLVLSQFILGLAALVGATPVEWWFESSYRTKRPDSLVTWVADRVQQQVARIDAGQQENAPTGAVAAPAEMATAPGQMTPSAAPAGARNAPARRQTPRRRQRNSPAKPHRQRSPVKRRRPAKPHRPRASRRRDNSRMCKRHKYR